jgi:phosphoribosyl-ATP pyrophosphohydrolase/phosphoribosyl-AMP cyclohydrolase
MKPDFKKYPDGLIPAIVQDESTLKVLMLGFMNEEAFLKTNEQQKVTFFSRSKNRLWTKGEESGNHLILKSISLDCDNDTFLVKAKPIGPTCHTGSDTCFNEKNESLDFLNYLESVISKGINKIAQKVGEEAIEVVIEAKDQNKDLFLNESADLLFHYLMLINAKGFELRDVINILKERHKK